MTTTAKQLYFSVSIFVAFFSTMLATKIFYFSLGLASRSVGLFDFFKIFYAYRGNPEILYPFFGISVAVLSLALGVLALGYKKRVKQKLHGESRVASKKDIKAMGLFSKDGLILGSHEGKLLRAPGLTPTILTAATRTGKGVSVVIPNLIAHKGSIIAYDPKLELYRTVSAYRANCGQGVFLFAPGLPYSHRWNPFDMWAKNDPTLFDNVNLLANILCPTPEGAKDAMWTQNARKFFIGAVYAMYDMGEYLTLPAILQWIDFYQMASPADDGDDGDDEHEHGNAPETLSYFLERSHTQLSDIALANLSFICGMPKVTAEGVKAQIVSSLQVFQSPSVAHAFSGSDFDLRDIRRKPTSLFVGSTKRTLETGASAYSLFFQIATMLLTENLPRKDEKHEVLLCLDEFTGLGPMSVIKRAVADIAGYKVRLFIIIQNFAQMKNPKMYAAEGLKEFLGNMEFELYFRPKMLEDAKEISAIMGDNTVKAISKSKPSFFKGFGGGGSYSENASEQKRALMLPQELMRMGDEQVLILKPGQPPVVAKKLCYYQDSRFRGKYYDVFSPDKTIEFLSPGVPIVPAFKDKFGVLTSNEFWENGLEEALDFDAEEISAPKLSISRRRDFTAKPEIPAGSVKADSDAPTSQETSKVSKRPNKLSLDSPTEGDGGAPIQSEGMTEEDRQAYVEAHFRGISIEDVVSQNFGSQAINSTENSDGEI
jgi:type IV secretion system protein VirD4